MNSLKTYLDKLDCSDEAERTYAAEDIGYLNAPDGVPALVERLAKESSRTVRDAIFQALIRIDADASIEGCIGLLASDDPQTRNEAVTILRHKGAASIPFLNAVMRDGDKHARKLVLDVLSGSQGGEADSIYRAALADSDPNVTITAVENLGKVRATQFRPRIEELLLADSHPMLVGACLEALGGIGNELSLAAIRLRFRDLATVPDFFLVSCLKAIGALGTPAEFIELAELLAVRAPHLRSPILSALNAIHGRHPMQIQGAQLLPVLRAMIENDPPLSRYQAAQALRYLASRDDVYEFLVSCLSNPERLVRLGAIESLRVTDRPELATVLASRALEEIDEEVLQALNG